MSNLARFVSPQMDLDTFFISDDFAWDQTDLSWVDTITDSGTALVGDAANGIMVLLPSDGSVVDNDEVYLATPNEVFLVAVGRELYFRARIQFTEGNTDDANVAMGFQSAVAANSIVDDGAGLRVTGNMFAIYKVDGGTVWRCGSRNGSGATSANVVDSVSTTTAGGAAYQVLEIFVKDWDGVNSEILFKVDGLYLRDTNGLVIRHTMAIASSTEMQAFFGMKNGASTTVETLNIDQVFASQSRA
jgi:hypothetical protein